MAKIHQIQQPKKQKTAFEDSFDLRSSKDHPLVLFSNDKQQLDPVPVNPSLARNISVGDYRFMTAHYNGGRNSFGGMKGGTYKNRQNTIEAPPPVDPRVATANTNMRYLQNREMRELEKIKKVVQETTTNSHNGGTLGRNFPVESGGSTSNNMQDRIDDHYRRMLSDLEKEINKSDGRVGTASSGVRVVSPGRSTSIISSDRKKRPLKIKTTADNYFELGFDRTEPDESIRITYAKL